jgi:hypothetical protein
MMTMANDELKQEPDAMVTSALKKVRDADPRVTRKAFVDAMREIREMLKPREPSTP